MNPKNPRPAIRRIVAAMMAGALALGGLASPARAAEVPVTATTVDLVDGSATDQTRSLFSYLRDVRGEGILFGHQHTTDYGESFDVRDGVASDVLAATGDHPAVFGFDTLIIEGRERPGRAEATREQNALTLAQSFREAHDLGGISTLSAHIENLATGGDFYDTSGDALRAVLPGGAKHADLVAYLDLIAVAADNAVDADGNPIPVIFRPWHENAGSWFWWGAAYGSPGEYKELFRFTVEYLRDVKGVHNFLYAFSPGGGFGGSAEQYLRTYPGDDYVDVLGFDTYDAAASATFLQGLVADLGMIATLADERGKISAFTEFGITGGVQPDGSNANTTWYTDVLEALKADPAASRTAYMATWANFGGATTPYTPLDGEMLPDFLAYHADGATLFADDLDGVFDRVTEGVAAAPTAHLASPADGARVSAPTSTLRASVVGQHADRVEVEVHGTGLVIALAAPAEGSSWWTGTWDIAPELLDNSTRGVTLRVFAGGAQVASVDSTVILGERPQLAAGVVDDFEGYGDDTALRSEYVQYNSNTISLDRRSVGEGDQALRFDYSFASQTYTGVGKQLSGDWSGFWDFEAWIDPDASGNKLVLQLVADGISFEAYPSLAGDGASLVTIPFADWRPAPWDTGHADARLTPERLADVTQFNIYVNAAEGGATAGSIVMDALRAVPGTPPPTTYSDVPRDHADYAAIEWLHALVDLGDGSGRFQPTRAASTAELAEALAAYDAAAVAPTSASVISLISSLWLLAGSPEAQQPTAFRDIPGTSQAAAAWAVETGLIEPKSSRALGGNARVDRAALARLLHLVDGLRPSAETMVLADFGDGEQGWAVPDWNAGNGGTAAAADGLLVIEAGSGGNWVSWAGSLDLSGRSQLLLDVASTTGLDTKAALQLGSDWTWCETGYTGWVGTPGSGENALAIDLTTLSSECAAMLDDVRGINLYVTEGSHQIDAVRTR
ncbi:glycosyl hydrolase [Tessaracoccus sp. G1721]